MGISALGEVACFRRMPHGAIVHFVRADCAMRARFVVAILSLALIYAFTCSATCAICLSPGAGAAAEARSHACENAARDAAGGSHQQEPAKPDCAGHRHSGFEVVQSDGFLRFQLSVRGRASILAEGVVGTDFVNVGSSFSSDLAPPGLESIFPQQKISILRI